MCGHVLRLLPSNHDQAAQHRAAARRPVNGAHSILFDGRPDTYSGRTVVVAAAEYGGDAGCFLDARDDQVEIQRAVDYVYQRYDGDWSRSPKALFTRQERFPYTPTANFICAQAAPSTRTVNSMGYTPSARQMPT